MSHRVVQDLIWARAEREAPAWAKTSRSKGAKAEGRRYERRLEKFLDSRAVHGQWFSFCDKNGLGWCQTDFLLPLRSVAEPSVLVIESKYSYVSEGHSQIFQLYKPVIEKAWGRKVYGLVACRRLVPGLDTQCAISSVLNGAIEAALAQRKAVWHWLG